MLARATAVIVWATVGLLASAGRWAYADTGESSAAHAADSAENQDLQLIPKAIRSESSAPPTGPAAPPISHRLYIEGAFSGNSLRGTNLVPAPSSSPHWQGRLLFDARVRWPVGEHTGFVVSDRLNLRAENDIDFPNHENFINDLREVYLSLQIGTRSYLDVGRVNLKSGVALGFNPTDFFKTRAVTEPLSADPTALREDRLGTVMLRAQRVLDRGSVMLVYAPQLKSRSALYSNLDLPSVDPGFDRTNGTQRWLLKGTANFTANFSPELLYYHEPGTDRVGLNLTRAFGRHSVAYLEWSGGSRTNLIDQALAYGRATGTLPAAAPAVLPENAERRFQSELAVGASYTTVSELTLNLEYHYDQAAFSAADWRRWFAVGTTTPDPTARAELWYLRAYASDRQQPVSRHSLFLLASWSDAFIPKLNLSGFVNTDLYDGSSLLQLSTTYDVSDHWTIGGLIMGYLGGRRTNYGSLPVQATVLVNITRYL